MDWNLFSNADWLIMVLFKPVLNKSLRILLGVQESMVLQVATVHDSNVGFSVTDTCCTGTDA